MSSLPASAAAAVNKGAKPDQVQILLGHIVRQLARHRSEVEASGKQGHEGATGVPPLIVGVQGPQGSGKTTVTLAIRDLLAQAPHNLNVAAFSIDDLYLPHSRLVSIARSDPSNVLLSGRGQPGTHDVSLGSEILRSLSLLNTDVGSSSPGEVRIPTFDKSAFGGEGDRGSETVAVKPPVDVVLFEGWCLGFGALGTDRLASRYEAARAEWASDAAEGEDESTEGKRPYFLDHPLSHLLTIDANLQSWKEAWYKWIGAFVQLVPITEEEAVEAEAQASSRLTNDEDEDDSITLFPPAPNHASAQSLETVFEWRGEAERKMRASNGGKGMSEEGVRRFVERYMPGYELFSGGVNDGDMPWHGRGIRVALDAKRRVRGVGRF